jgi:hypothetical protein
MFLSDSSHPPTTDLRIRMPQNRLVETHNEIGVTQVKMCGFIILQ